jgi:predicted phage baseplate assembly protein
VGAESLAHLVSRSTAIGGVQVNLSNPLPALGGTPPEPLAEVRLFAPGTARLELERAITPDDYARLVERGFAVQVQRAAAARRATGHCDEVHVAVDARGRLEPAPALLDEIAAYLARYRRIGHDVVVMAAAHVPLAVALEVCVLPGYLRGHVKAALLEVFSSQVRRDGTRGFFHPDNLSFGDGVYLISLVALAQAVPGVESVRVTQLERLGEGPAGELEGGRLPLGPLEIARLDNDPSFPENGQLHVALHGGR